MLNVLFLFGWDRPRPESSDLGQGFPGLHRVADAPDERREVVEGVLATVRVAACYIYCNFQ